MSGIEMQVGMLSTLNGDRWVWRCTGADCGDWQGKGHESSYVAELEARIHFLECHRSPV